MLVLVAAAYVYWVLWALALPFVQDLPLALLFPPPVLLVKAPVLLLVMGTAAVGLFVGVALLQAAEQQPKDKEVRQKQSTTAAC